MAAGELLRVLWAPARRHSGRKRALIRLSGASFSWAHTLALALSLRAHGKARASIADPEHSRSSQRSAHARVMRRFGNLLVKHKWPPIALAAAWRDAPSGAPVDARARKTNKRPFMFNCFQWLFNLGRKHTRTEAKHILQDESEPPRLAQIRLD